VGADFLYLLPSVDDTYFVFDSPESTIFPNGKRENNDFHFHPGFRVSAAYSACGDQWIQLDYAMLQVKRSKTVQGDFLWATIGRSSLTSSFENYPGSASSRLDLLYQRADAFLVQQTLTCGGMDVSLKAGLEYAFLRLNEDFAYQRVAVLGEISQRSKTWGIGPEIGFGLDYAIDSYGGLLPGNLSLAVQASGSILSSQTTMRNFNALGGVAVLNEHDKNTWRVVPALHARIGLNYGSCLSWGDASIEVGYEFNTYFRGLSRLIFPDDVADGLCFNEYYNFDVQGLYVCAGLKF
jgi:hypothetical protein